MGWLQFSPRHGWVLVGEFDEYLRRVNKAGAGLPIRNQYLRDCHLAEEEVVFETIGFRQPGVVAFHRCDVSSQLCEGKDSMTQELSKITFIYYGTSPSHLVDILRLDGVECSTDNEIAKQNPSTGSCSKFWSALPTLMYLCAQCESKSWENFEASESRTTPVKDDYVNLSGRQRSVSKRKFTSGNIFWSGKPGEELNDVKPPWNSVADAGQRALKLHQRRNVRDVVDQRRMLHGALQTSFGGTRDPYELWWLCAKNEKNRDVQAKAQPELPSWKITPQPSEFSLDEPKGGRRDVLVHDPSQIDAWRCGCEVCSGNLLFVKGKHHVEANLLLPGYVAMMQQESQCKDSARISLNGKMEGKRSRSHTTGKRKLYKQGQKKSAKSLGQSSKTVLAKSPTKKHTPTSDRLKKLKTSKLFSPRSEWWTTVTDYTTPYWKIKKEKSEELVKPDEERKTETELSVEEEAALLELLRSFKSSKLKMTYSDERLQEMKQDLQSKATSAQGLARGSQVSRRDSMDARDLPYLHTPGATALYTKLPNIASEQEGRRNVVEVRLSDKGKRSSLTTRALHTSSTQFDPPPVPPTSILTSDDKCRRFVSDATIAECKSARKSLLYDVLDEARFFEPLIPKHFRAMCAAALRCFVVRREKVMTSQGKKVNK